jgi:hypothetical protein
VMGSFLSSMRVSSTAEERLRKFRVRIFGEYGSEVLQKTAQVRHARS